MYEYIDFAKWAYLWNPLVRSHTYHVHLHAIGIMYSKFPLDDLKTVGGVSGTTFHQQINRL